MIDDATVARVAKHWDDGWNAGDIETIMAPFADDVVFSSPFVPKLAGDPAVTAIRGTDALRSYCIYALDRTPGIRYTVHGAYAGADAVVLVYSSEAPDGTIRRGADSMLVDDDGRVTEWRSHYSVDSMDFVPGPTTWEG